MRDIAKLLFGDDAGKVLDMFGAGGDEAGLGEEAGMAERARRSGEWCGTTPGRDSAASAVKRAARPRRGEGQIIIRIRGW